MKKKTAFLIIVLILLVIVGVFAWLMYTSPESIPFLELNTGEGGNRGFFPFFGGGTDTATTSDTTNEPRGITPPTDADTSPLPLLRDVSQVPVSGAAVFDDPENEFSRIRFVERATGNIFEATTNSRNRERITNTTIPGTERAIFADDGNALILQYQNSATDIIETFFGSTTPAEASLNQSEKVLRGAFLPDNIIVITPGETTKDIFYLLKEDDGGTRGFISNMEGTKGKHVFTSGVSEWQALWPKEDSVVLTTNASGNDFGYSYLLNTKSGMMSPLITRKQGLTVLPNHDLTKVLYGQFSTRDGITLTIFDTKDRNETSLSLKTFPEKCVWSKTNKNLLYCGGPQTIPAGLYPDVWYQGMASLSDSLWSIDVESGDTELVADFEKISGERLDMTDLFMSSDEKYLFFTNKSNLHLWGFMVNI